MFTPAPGRIALRRLDPAPDPRALAAQFVMPSDNKEKSTRCEVVAIPDRMHRSDFGIAVPSPAEVGERNKEGSCAEAQSSFPIAR